MRIIRHSDDLGITFQSTAQLLNAWQAGHLDGFSIIANGDAIELISVGLASDVNKPARIAVHFNLTEGPSSALPSDIPLLVDAEGMLKHTFGSLLMAFLFASKKRKLELRRQIAIECTAQIIAVQSICNAKVRSLTAIDGHNHIHMIPGVFSEVARCAVYAGIPEIRVSSEPFYIEKPWRDWQKLFWWVNLIKHFLLKILSVNARQQIGLFGLRAPDAIIGILYTGSMSAVRALCGIKAATAKTEIEVVFHIGRAHPDEVGRWQNSAYASFHLSEGRDTERAELYLLTKLLENKSVYLKR